MSRRPLDPVDRTLLRLLQEDGRRSYKELGAVVGLAPSTVHGRVRRLEEEGVLRGVHADVDGAALGIGLRAMVFVQLHSQAAPVTRAFREAVVGLPEVLGVFEVAGRFDFLLHLICRDPEHLRRVYTERLATVEGVRNIETALIFEAWRASVLPDWAP
jgi:DNA-binding Lrp family transcriptional regulator